jgi:ankyrin repeat protein
MDTLPLPHRPDLEQYRKRAKNLVKVARSDDPDAVHVWATDWLRTLVRLRGTDPPFVQRSLERVVDELAARVRSLVADGRFALADAQFLIARTHGFPSWRALAQHVERLSAGDDPFETAADSAVAGDLDKLRSLLSEQRDLIRARSPREHRATLLHYVAANGVENFRQQTPPNAVEVATMLLEAGAEVDALADTYGGGTAQTTLNLLVSSVHPAEAGLQTALVETLLDYGAVIEGLQDDGSPLMTALAFGYVEAAETLASRGARIDNVISAAALGRVDLVEDILNGGATLSPSLAGLYWLGLSNDPQSHVERAFVWACAYGRASVVELLLDHGVDPAATDNHDMTGLQWAEANGHSDVVALLR